MCGNKDNYKHMPKLYCFSSHLEKILKNLLRSFWSLLGFLHNASCRSEDNTIWRKPTYFTVGLNIVLNFNSLTKVTYYIGVLQNCHSNIDIFCIVKRSSIHCECLLLIQSNHIEVRFSCIVLSNKYTFYFWFASISLATNWVY